MEHLSLQRLRGGGLDGSSFTVNPGRCATKVFGYGHLSPSEGILLCGGWARIPGTLITEGEV